MVHCGHIYKLTRLSKLGGLAPSGPYYGTRLGLTQQLRAKLLDPSAAFLLTGKLSEHAVSCVVDIKQLVEILLSLLNATCPAFLFTCDRLRDIAVGVDRVERKGDCYSLSEMKGLLHGLQQTAECHCCPRGRQLVCQDLDE